MRKIILIIAISLVSIYLFFQFVLFSFPYHALISRIDEVLRTDAGARLAVEEAFYRYPLALDLREVALSLQENTFITAGRVSLRVRPRVFSSHREFEVRAYDVGMRSENVELSGLKASIDSLFNLLPLLRGAPTEGMNGLLCTLGGADIQRVTLGGFEFSSLKLRGARFGLIAEEQWYIFQDGAVTADVITTQVSGRLNPSRLDLSIVVQLTDEFYQRYRDLRGLAESFFTDGSLEIQLGGTPQNPQARLNKRSAR
jgi:hypothetical protein